MAVWNAIAPTRPWVTDDPGACLRYAQSFFGAPVKHRSAWHAWNATQHKHGVTEPLPGVPVLLWFSHYGEYNDGAGRYGDDPARPYWGNWGHVAINVPGVGVYTSPGFKHGSEVWDSIAQVESRFGARYVGWSEDINGLRVAQLDGAVPVNVRPMWRGKESRNMFVFVDQPGIGVTYAVFELGVRGSWWQFIGQDSATQLASQRGNAMKVDLSAWGDLKNRHS